jgi:2-haloacid dehalogenase
MTAVFDAHSSPVPIEAVVFDLGNVLISWDPHPAIAKGVGPEVATRFLADRAFDFNAWNRLQDAGRRWNVAEDLAIESYPHWERAIRAYRANFEDSMVGVIEDSVQILQELRVAGIPLYGLTNWSGELFPLARRRFEFLDVFEDIIVSGDEGVAKPDPKIFEILRQRVDHNLGACIFIDDSMANVAAAREAGLNAILFTDTGHLREDLSVRGLPLTPA